MRSQLTKRAFDLAFAGVAMAVLAPFLAILALAIRLRIGTPVLFVQLRPGLGGAPGLSGFSGSRLGLQLLVEEGRHHLIVFRIVESGTAVSGTVDGVKLHAHPTLLERIEK